MNDQREYIGAIGRTHCPRCGVTWMFGFEIEPAIVDADVTPTRDIDELLTSCPVCGGETRVLELPAVLKAAIEGNRNSEEVS